MDEKKKIVKENIGEGFCVLLGRFFLVEKKKRKKWGKKKSKFVCLFLHSKKIGNVKSNTKSFPKMGMFVFVFTVQEKHNSLNFKFPKKNF